MTEHAGLEFEPDALRAKYAQERTRRLRADGINQYVEISGAFARFGEDPWADPSFARHPITDTVDVACGAAGLGPRRGGPRLRDVGVVDVRRRDYDAERGERG